MAEVAKIVTTGTGVASDYIRCGPGYHVIELTWAGSAGNADLQHRSVGTSTFRDVYDENGVVNVTGNKSFIVPGNQEYTVDVNTHTSALTVTVSHC